MNAESSCIADSQIDAKGANGGHCVEQHRHVSPRDENRGSGDSTTKAARLRSTEHGTYAIPAILLVAAMFFCLPVSYHTPPVAVSAIFAGLLTKVGVYSLIRAFTLLFVTDLEFTHNLLLLIAGRTMVTGVLGAMAQTEIRRILSFHIAKTDQEITLLANLITLTPDTLSLDVSEDRRTLYVHAMFVDSPDNIRDSIKNGFERRLLELTR